MSQHASGGRGADVWLAHHQLASWRRSGTRTVSGLLFLFRMNRWTWTHMKPNPPSCTFWSQLGTHWGPIGDPRGTEIWSVQWAAQKAAADGPIQGVRNPVDTRHPMVQWAELYGIGTLTVLWTRQCIHYADSLCRYLHGMFIIVYEHDTEWYWTMLTLFFLWAGTDQCQLRGGATCPGRSSGEGFLLCCT